jgi:hypothetical protein
MSKDYEKLWAEGPDPLADVTEKQTAPIKARKTKEQNYLHEDMKEIVAGANATTIVWLRLLQLRKMRKEKTIVLANEWLTQHGVDRYGKTRALQTLKKRGLIRVEHSDHRSPRVVIIPRRDRRRAIQK